MSATEEHASRVVRRDAGATRQRILDAGRRLFADRGYPAASTRDIAALAGSDPRLITRYFGSKEGLFSAVVEQVYEKSLMMTPATNDAAARTLLLDDDAAAEDGLLLTLRSASDAHAAGLMRAALEDRYQARLAAALPGEEDALGRAALLVSICSGVLLQRLVLGNTALTGPQVERLVPRLRAALDAVAAD